MSGRMQRTQGHEEGKLVIMSGQLFNHTYFQCILEGF